MLRNKKCTRCNIYRERKYFIRPDKKRKMVFNRYCNFCYYRKRLSIASR